jgi:hypothetical protein
MFLQMLVSTCKITYFHNPENYNLNIHCYENLKSYTIMTVYNVHRNKMWWM